MEFVRHRVFSFAQESTRYCNYSKKDKFNEEITFIKPIWLEEPTRAQSDWESRKMIESDFDEEGVWYEECYKYEGYPRINSSSWQWNSADWFYHQLKSAETTYLQLLKQGWKAQEARAVLPNSLYLLQLSTFITIPSIPKCFNLAIPFNFSIVISIFPISILSLIAITKSSCTNFFNLSVNVSIC
jgi:hypothetical protein